MRMLFANGSTLPWRVVAGVVGSALLLSGTSRADTIVSDFRDNFNNGTTVGQNANTFSNGWAYYWNAPTSWNGTATTASDGTTGIITSTADWEPLKWAFTSGTSGPGSWRPDGDLTNTNGEPAAFMTIASNGSGHPGRGTNQAGGVSNNRDRFLIFAYTVAAAGEYAVTNTSFSTVDAVGDGNTLRVFTNNTVATPELNTTFTASTATGRTFDTNLGTLAAGDTIYVAVGAGPLDGNDNFTIDYSITQVPEPGSVVALALAAGVGLCRRRRGRR